MQRDTVMPKLTADDRLALHMWLEKKVNERLGRGDISKWQNVRGQNVSGVGFDVDDFFDVLYEECPEAIMAMFRAGADQLHEQGEGNEISLDDDSEYKLSKP